MRGVRCSVRSTRLVFVLPPCRHANLQKLARVFTARSGFERLAVLGLVYPMASPPGQNSRLLDGAEVAATAVRATGAGLDAIDASHNRASHDRAR